MSNENAEVSGANSDPFEKLVEILSDKMNTTGTNMLAMPVVELFVLAATLQQNGLAASQMLERGELPDRAVLDKLDTKVLAALVLKGAASMLPLIGEVVKAINQAKKEGHYEELLENAKIADSVIDEYPEATEAELMAIMHERRTKRAGRPPEPESFNPLGRAFGGDK